MANKRVFVATDLHCEQHRHERMAVFLAEELGSDLEVFYTETGLEKTLLHMSELETNDPLKVQNMPTSVSKGFHQDLEKRFSSYKNKYPEKLHTTVRFGNKSSLTEVEIQNNLDKIECVILGRKSRNVLAQFFSGTLTQKLCGKIDAPVLVVPEDSKVLGFKKILYATALDEVPPSYEEKIKSFAERLGATVQLIHVSEFESDSINTLGRFNSLDHMASDNYSDLEVLQKKIEEGSKKRLKQHAERFGSSSNNEPIFTKGNAAKEILKQVEISKPDFLVLGNHKQGALEKLFLGSLGQKLISNATCPVMVFPH